MNMRFECSRDYWLDQEADAYYNECDGEDDDEPEEDPDDEE
jgi:hypothetical protein